MRDIELNNYIDKQLGKPFEWGTCDCLLFVADWCVHMCRIDPAHPGRLKYHTEEKAYELLKKERGCLEGVFDACFERVNTSFAKQGDVAIATVNGKKTCGIVGYNSRIWFKTEKYVVPMKIQPVACWRVPCLR